MFDKFSLPDVAAVSRRTVFSALAVGVVGLVACVLLGAALIGVGACIGIGLGISNFRLIQKSVAKVGRRADPNHRRPLALNTVGRLAVISAVVLGLLFLSFDLGAGVLGGLAVFQALLLLNVLRSMLKMGAGGGGLAGVVDVDPLGSDGSGGTLEPPGDAVEVPDDRRGR
ncbi:MAG: hypothetical protein ACYCU7_15295 [Acidimicrobiales bacterium]